MALISCHECRAQISNDAKSCPKCGAANKKLTRMQAIWLSAMLVALLVYFLEAMNG